MRLATCLALLLASPAWSATFWVSPTGTSGASGLDSTSNAKSLAWAVSSAPDGSVIRFKSGTYSTGITSPNGGTASNRVYYYGFQDDPTAVSVNGIDFGTSDYVTVKWMMTHNDLDMSAGFDGAVGDSVLKVRVTNPTTGINFMGDQSVMDSVTVVSGLCADGFQSKFIMAYATGGDRTSNNRITNSVFNVNVDVATTRGCFVYGMQAGQYHVIANNTWNITLVNADDYFFPLGMYKSYYNLFQSNTWNINYGRSPSWTNGVLMMRDTSSFNRFFRNTWNITGVAQNNGANWTNSGSAPGSTSNNYFGFNVWKSSGTPFGMQNGSRSDTLEFNVFAVSSGKALLDNGTSGQTLSGLVARHNTFYGTTNPIVDLGAMTPSGTNRFSSSIVYSTTANGTTSLVRMPAASGVFDSAGVAFARGGTASAYFSYGGTTGTPGSGGNYGISGKAVAKTPRFVDSTFATLDVGIYSDGFARGPLSPSLHDGFAGVYSDSLGGQTAAVTGTAPDSTVYLRITDATTTAVSLRWNSPADDDATGAASSYDVRYSTSAITNANWSSATQATGEPVPSPAGTVENMTVTGLAAATTYHFAMKSADGFSNISGLSNVPDTTTDAAAVMNITEHRIQAKDDVAGYTFTIGSDDDSSATVTVLYGVASPSDTAATPVRRFATSGTYATSLFGLTPETTYKLRVSVVDGASTLTFDTTFVTRRLRWWAGTVTGPSVYVSPDGSDSNSGLTSGAPKRTLANAYAVLVGLENGGRGGALRLAAGTYYQRNSLDGGSGKLDSGYYILPQNEGETVIISGADERLVNGTATLSWSAANAAADPERAGVGLGDTLFRAAYTATDSLDGLWVGGWSYFRFTTDAEIWNKQGTSGGGGVDFLTTLAPGCYYFDDAADSIYIRPRTGTNIRTATLYAGYRRDLIELNDPYMTVRNITFRHAGGLPEDNGIAVRIGQNGGANNSVVQGCTFEQLDRAGVHGQEVAGRADSLVVAQCVYDGAGTERFGYAAAKSRREEQRGLMSARGFFNTVIENTVRYSFNGISQNGSASSLTEMSETDISRNTVHDVSDDALEAESGHGVNLRMVGNTLRRFGNGISLAPVWTGPAWIIQNFGRYSTSGGGMFKIGDGAAGPSRGDCLIYHNTFVPDTTSNNYGMGAPGGQFGRKRFRNNVLHGSGTSWPAVRNTLTGADTLGAVSNSFNYDLLYTTGSTRVMLWKNTSYDSSTVSTLLAWEGNGVRGLHPAWQDTSRGLWNAGRGVDRGMRLSGITGALVSVRGAAPDMGAFEQAVTSSQVGSRPRWYSLREWFRNFRAWFLP